RGPRCRRCSRARPGRDRRRDHRRRARNLGERAPSRGGTASSSAGDQAVARPSSGKEETPMPGWMRTIDDFTLVKAAGAGFALTALNPKNVLLVAAAAAEIAEVGLSAGREIAVLAAFVILASLGVITPVVVSLALGDRSRALLEGLRGWMARYNAVIM